MCFLSTTFPNAPAHPPLHFLTSPLPFNFQSKVLKQLKILGIHIIKGYLLSDAFPF